MYMRKNRWFLIFCIAVTASVLSQADGQYDLSRNTIDGGGGVSSGGHYLLTGTIGQPDAGTTDECNGGNYILNGGFLVGKPVLPVPDAHWWKFDEGSGTVAYDSVGDNDGNLYGEPNWIDGALSFDGIDDYVAVPCFTVNTNNGTIALLFKTDADFSANYGSMGYLISQDNPWYSYLTVAGDGTGSYWIIGETDLQDDYFVIAEGAAPKDTWNNVVVSFYNKTAKTYLNGKLIDTRSVSYSSLALALIGGRTLEFFKGEIDDVRVYNRALSSEEIE